MNDVPNTQHGVRARARFPVRPDPGPPAQVGVVVPCYNYARFLREAVDSVLNQVGVRVSVVIVDDASTDDSRRVAEQLAGADARVQVLAHQANLGPVESFNDGMAQVDGEFLVRLDADDTLTPGSLARAVAVARAVPSVGLIYGHPLHFSVRPQRPRERVTGWTVWPGDAWLEGRCRAGVNVITAPEAFMRRSVVDEVGGQRALAHTHDMEMWLRLAAHSDVAYIHGADQAWHREHNLSLSNNAQSAGGLTILEERRAAFRTLVEGGVPGGDRIWRLASTTLAREALSRAAYEFDRGRATPELTSALIAFAEETSPLVHDMPEWEKLCRRRAAGSKWASRRPWLKTRPLVRVAQDQVRGWRWRTRGVYGVD